MDDHFVYILQSDNTTRYYTGISGTPDIRLYYLNEGLNKSTRSGRPWSRVWLSGAMSKSEALKLERKIKKRGAKRFLEDL